MKTSLRLLAMLVTSVGLFALSWYFFGREHPQPEVPSKPKTTQELLIGTWEIVEQEPPIRARIKATMEFTKDGKRILHLTDSQYGLLPSHPGAYQLTGEHIRFDYPENPHHPHQTWFVVIEVITDDTLILRSVDEKADTRRMVLRRVKDN